MNDVVKFPTTPHLFPPQHGVQRDDKVLDEQSRDTLLSHEIILEEKIDGANLGLYFDQKGDLVLKNRGHVLSKPFTMQWKKLEHWISLHEDALFECLADKYALFGEWCYAKHSIKYVNLPDWFIGFDIYDRYEKKFVSVDRRNSMLRNHGITIIPQIARGKFTLDKIIQMNSNSKYGHETAEGVYIRYDNVCWNIMRAKYVRSSFTQTIGQHWSKQGIEPNELCQ